MPPSFHRVRNVSREPGHDSAQSLSDNASRQHVTVAHHIASGMLQTVAAYCRNCWVSLCIPFVECPCTFQIPITMQEDCCRILQLLAVSLYRVFFWDHQRGVGLRSSEKYHGLYCIIISRSSVVEWSERRTSNPKSRVQFPALTTYWICNTVIPGFNSLSLLLNNQLVSVPPVGIINMFMLYLKRLLLYLHCPELAQY